MVRRRNRRQLGLDTAAARAEVDFDVVLDQPLDGRRARVVEGPFVGDVASDEVDGVWVFNRQPPVGERHGAIVEERLEEAGLLIVLADLEEEAEDGGIAAIPAKADLVGGDGNEDAEVVG